jgi:transposase InsO family protein
MMTRLLEVHHSGYYSWRKQRDQAPETQTRAGRRERLKVLIHGHWNSTNGAHGVRRIQVDLARTDGEIVSHWLVLKLMRELGIAGIQPRSTKRTTIPDPDADDREDLIARDFNAPVATTKLVGDITYLKTAQGWMYLSTVICLTTRMVVGWHIADHMRTTLISEALKMAHNAGYVAGNAIFHSDRGAQYTSAEFAKLAKMLDIRLSVGRTGSCHDNAVAESFFSFLKNEMFHLRKFETKEQAKLAIFEYIEIFYNRRRRHSTLGYNTPMEAMQLHLRHDGTDSYQLTA